MPALSLLKASNIEPSVLRDYTRPDKDGNILVGVTKHPELPIFNYNYTGHTEHKKRWDAVTLACRSIILDDEGTVVARSFSKFFNHHESSAYQPVGSEERVIFQEKLDGSLMLHFWYAGEWRWSSRKSFESPHVQMATNMWNEKYPGKDAELDKSYTYVFELIHPKNHIGVIYGSTEELYLIGMFQPDGTEPPYNFNYEALGLPRPKIYEPEDPEFAKLVKLDVPNAEGWVATLWWTLEDRRPARIKVKLEAYMDLIKSKRSISPAVVLEQYQKGRAKVITLDASEAAQHMREKKAAYLEVLAPIADDFGKVWLKKIEETWDKADKYFVENNTEFCEVIKLLESKGFHQGQAKGSKDNILKRNFAKEANKTKYQRALFLWHQSTANEGVVHGFIQAALKKAPAELEDTCNIGVENNTNALRKTPKVKPTIGSKETAKTGKGKKGK